MFYAATIRRGGFKMKKISYPPSQERVQWGQDTQAEEASKCRKTEQPEVLVKQPRATEKESAYWYRNTEAMTISKGAPCQNPNS